MTYLLDRGFQLSYEDYIRALYLACQFFAPKCLEYSTAYSIDNPKTNFGIIPEKKETKKLLADLDERENQIRELFNRLFGDSLISVYHLSFEDTSIEKGGVAGFHDSWDNMYLNIEKKEFEQFQDILEKEGFPRDLFYNRERQKSFCRPAKMLGIFNALKFKIFSPKEWEALSEDEKEEFINNWES